MRKYSFVSGLAVAAFAVSTTVAHAEDASAVQPMEVHDDVSLASFHLVIPVAEVDDAGGRSGADARLGCTMFCSMEKSHAYGRITRCLRC